MRVTTMMPTPQRNIEDVLCSKTRLKILKLLIDSQLTPSEIARAVGVNYLNMEHHLEILESEGILTHSNFGKRIHYYKYSESSPKAKAVRHLIESFEAYGLDKVVPEEWRSVDYV